MGVYLSEPNKDKHWQEGSGPAYSFVSAEMQGTFLSIQVGERAWKMRPFITATLAMATVCSRSSTATEVRFSL